jgi:thiol:disulfide interchange protein DsbA
MSQKQAMDPRVARVQRLIVGGAGVLVALLALWGILYATGVFGPRPVPGEGYTAIPGTTPPAAGAEVEILEFFSYTCVHCRNFEAQLADLADDLPEGATLRRVHVIFGNPGLRAYAAAYYALEELDLLASRHERLFAAIHDRGQLFHSVDDLADFLAGHGADREQLRRQMLSPGVQAKVRAGEELERRMQVQETPTLVVGGHFRLAVSALGRANAVDVALDLAGRLRRGETP